MKLFINAQRTDYSTAQIQHTMTVGELIAALEEFDEDTPVFGGCTWSGRDSESYQPVPVLLWVFYKDTHYMHFNFHASPPCYRTVPQLREPKKP